jgi:hypothetical protein
MPELAQKWLKSADLHACRDAYAVPFDVRFSQQLNVSTKYSGDEFCKAATAWPRRRQGSESG